MITPAGEQITARDRSYVAVFHVGNTRAARNFV